MTSLSTQEGTLALKELDYDLDLNNNQFRLPMASSRLYWSALREYVWIFKTLIQRNLCSRIIRDHQFVSTEYEQDYAPCNDEYVAGRDAMRAIFLDKNRPVYVDGWYINKNYSELLLKVISRLDVSSILEVGSGRGKNLVLLALSRPDLKFVGLEMTSYGVMRSKQSIQDLPKKYLTVAGCDSITQEQEMALRTVRFHQANALEMPFPDKSFDFAFTCLVLEQMPHQYKQALQEMRRVTRKYCAFIEPFAEANNLLGILWLRSVDYFRNRYQEFAKFGLEPIYFTKAFPQKLRFNAGLLVARVVD